MPRKPREDAEPGFFHIFARGYGKLAIFRDRADREAYLGLFGRTVVDFGWSCLAYCLMDNHVHLLLGVKDANLGAGMQRFHGRYGQMFNRRHGRMGHLFQGRYGAVRIKSDEQMWAVVNYIVNNPVEAGLCSRPEEWLWSSQAAVLGGDRPEWLDVPALLGWYEQGVGNPLTRYCELTGSDPLSNFAQGV